ncbi:hypothetical protein, partial [Novosphingobium album (ex Liu et al. 2023)]
QPILPAIIVAAQPAIVVVAAHASLPRLPTTHLVYGTGPEADPALINLDSLHAARFRAIQGVHVHTIAEAGHAIVEWLIHNKLIDKILAQWLLPSQDKARINEQPPPFRAIPPSRFCKMDDGWRAWIAENLALGANRDELLLSLANQGFHPGEAQREIDKATRSPYLQAAIRLAKRIPELP